MKDGNKLRHVLEGRCVTGCGRPSVEDRTHCEECGARERVRKREYMRARRGLQPSRKRCGGCREQGHDVRTCALVKAGLA